MSLDEESRDSLKHAPLGRYLSENCTEAEEDAS